MSFEQFADLQYVKTIDISEEPRMGSFNVVNDLELQYIRVLLFISGSTVGNERIRLKIYGDMGSNNILYTSNWSNINDISGLSTYWLGYIRVDFNRENINKDTDYYVRAELDNYTRNGDTFFIGLCHDFPFPIYDNGQDLFYEHPLAMQIFGYQDR